MPCATRRPSGEMINRSYIHTDREQHPGVNPSEQLPQTLNNARREEIKRKRKGSGWVGKHHGVLIEDCV